MNNRKEFDRNTLINAKINPFGGETPIDEVMICICACVLGIAIYSLTENVLFSIAFLALIYWIHWLDDKSHQRVAYIGAYQFSNAIKARIGQHYPHLSDDQLMQVIQALRLYFQLCNVAAGVTVSMPSRVVDIAWHEFIWVLGS